MQSRITAAARSRLWLVVIVVAYPVAALFPFNFASYLQPNQARLVGDGALHVVEPGLALVDAPRDWAQLAAGGSLILQLRVRPDSADQRGPARILTFSDGFLDQNLTVGQHRAHLVVRMRPLFDPDGLRGSVAVGGLFSEPGWRDIEVRIDPARLTVSAEGYPAKAADLPAGALATWDPGLQLAFGNEPVGQRPWRGRVARARLIGPGGELDLLAPERLTFPPRLQVRPFPLSVERALNFSIRDWAINLAGFIPLGFTVALRGSGGPARPRRLARLVAMVLLVSLTLEVLQFYLPTRVPSPVDVLLNTLSGLAGILLARRCQQHESDFAGPGT